MLVSLNWPQNSAKIAAPWIALLIFIKAWLDVERGRLAVNFRDRFQGTDQSNQYESKLSLDPPTFVGTLRLQLFLINSRYDSF